MNLVSHLERLQEKHSHLEKTIQSELRRPAPNAMILHDLKSRKLAIKEEIERLRR